MSGLLRAFAAILGPRIIRHDAPASVLGLDVDQPVIDEPKPDEEPAPRETAAAPEPEPVRPPVAVLDPCVSCGIRPRLTADFCGDVCQSVWMACAMRVHPLETIPPTLPDGSIYRRTT